MKALNNGGELIKTPLWVKISILLFLCVAFFLLGKHWSDISHRHELLFFSTTSSSLSVSISPNFNKFYDISSLINSSQTNSSSPNSPGNGGSSLSSPAPAPEKVVKVGIVSENGTMTEDFEVGEYDPTVVENWGNGTGSENDESETRVRVRVHKFPLCLDSLREYFPCVDNEEAIRQLKSTERGERFDRLSVIALRKERS